MAGGSGCGRSVRSSIKKAVNEYLDLGSTLRKYPVHETLRRLDLLLAKIGITRVADITGLDCIGLPCALAIRPNAKHLSVAMGKGLSFELAKASAIMEALEVYHVENPPPVSATGTYREAIKKWPVISPRELNSGFFNIPHLEEMSLNWVKAIELMTGSDVFIPHVLTNMDSTTVRPEYGFLQVSTNGLAAGNTEEEALCHGLYEVIERDSLFRWSSLSDHQREATRLNLASIDSVTNRPLVEKYLQQGIQLKVWDITSHVGIPSVHSVIYDPNPFRVQGIFRGTGTHLSKEIALARALMEAAQSRLGVISGSRDDIFSDQYQQRFHVVDSLITPGKLDYSAIKQEALPSSFEMFVKEILQKLARSGFEKVYCVKHTKSDIQIPVVQVFVPGMRFRGARI